MPGAYDEACRPPMITMPWSLQRSVHFGASVSQTDMPDRRVRTFVSMARVGNTRLQTRMHSCRVLVRQSRDRIPASRKISLEKLSPGTELVSGEAYRGIAIDAIAVDDGDRFSLARTFAVIETKKYFSPLGSRWGSQTSRIASIEQRKSCVVQKLIPLLEINLRKTRKAGMWRICSLSGLHLIFYIWMSKRMDVQVR